MKTSTVEKEMSEAYKPTPATPLQKILGFQAAEETYDLLDFREQLILDLRIVGWSQEEIGEVFGLSQGWISIIFRQIRFKLADGSLQRTLELRQYYKETHPQVVEYSGGSDQDRDDNQ